MLLHRHPRATGYDIPTVCHFESCTNNLMKLVDLLAASYLLWVLADGIHTAIVIDVVLIASYCTTSHCLSL